MAEGMTRVNQQVVDKGHWATSERVTADDRGSGSGQRILSAREQSRVRIGDVLRAVEADIIPRVLMARQNQGLVESASHMAPAEAEIAEFSNILLAHGDQAAAACFVETIRARGISIETVYIELFQPAARHIGALWDADLCSFVDVTLALGMLQRLLRELSPAFQKDERRFDAGRQALLVPLPGDQHTFGLSLVAEFFRRSAWSVWTAPFACSDDLASAMRDTWFTVVGFSVSTEARLDELAAVIRVVRRSSCNRAVGVLVGGPVFLEHPDYVARVGADGVGLDARHAVVQAESFTRLMAER